MYIERTNYWAKAGHLDEVVELRRTACAVRASLGLPPGVICRKVGEDGPDLRWTCVFPDEKTYLEDLAVRAANPDFLGFRERLPAMVELFERHVEVLDETSVAIFEGADLTKIFV